MSNLSWAVVGAYFKSDDDFDDDLPQRITEIEECENHDRFCEEFQCPGKLYASGEDFCPLTCTAHGGYKVNIFPVETQKDVRIKNLTSV